MGGYYVPNPNQYTQVAAYSVARDNTIPSGASIVQGIYYMWDENGFTGGGWMYGVTSGPTNSYPDFDSDKDVAEYVASKGNLDDVFKHWSTVYNKDGWHAFYTAVGIGCMDVIQSQT